MEEQVFEKRVLIIGKNSYIGSNFKKLSHDRHPDWKVTAAGASDGAWEKTSLEGYDCILFTAALVHQKEKKIGYASYYQVNCELPVRAAKKAKEAGIGQFIFLSSMAVFGSQAERITMDTKPAPDSFYGKSKYEAENQLRQLQDEKFQVTIVRPPMVYGEGCPGNYGKLKRLARYLFLFPDTKNQRSMIEIGRLSEELLRLAEKNAAGIFHVQDKKLVNPARMIKQIRAESGKKIWLFSWLNWILIPISKRVGVFRKVFGNLWYDNESEKGNY